MIEKVLEAYIVKTSGKDSLWKKLDRLNTLTKSIFWGSIVCGFIIITLSLIFRSQTMLFIMIGYVIILYILTSLLERMRHKKWESNLKKYNEDLDEISEILKQNEFQLYEKNKIKQLICKYNKSIEQQDDINTQKSSSLKEFIYTYVFPLIAFFSGRLIISNPSNEEWVAICIALIIILVSAKYTYSAIMEMVAMISWNQLEKEKHFVLKLQDLLDRDFIIEDSDLLSSR